MENTVLYLLNNLLSFQKPSQSLGHTLVIYFASNVIRFAKIFNVFAELDPMKPIGKKDLQRDPFSMSGQIFTGLKKSLEHGRRSCCWPKIFEFGYV